MTTRKRLNLQTYRLAAMYSCYAGGNVRASDLAIQFGISKRYASKILLGLYNDGIISRKHVQWRSNSVVYEYGISPYDLVMKFRAVRDNAYHALLEVYAFKHMTEIAVLHEVWQTKPVSS